MASIILLALTLGATSLTILQIRNWGLSDIRLGVAALVSATGALLLAWRSKRTSEPIIDAALLKGRAYRASMLASGLIAMAMFANLVMQSQYLQKVWGYSVLKSGFGVIPMAASAGLMSTFSARLANRYNHRSVILTGTGLTAGGMFLLAFGVSDSPSRYWTVFFPALVIIGLGAWGMAISMINASAAATLNPDNFSVGMAIMQTTRQIGSILGASVFFGLLGKPGPDEIVGRFRELWLLLAALTCIAFAFCLSLPRAAGPTAPAPTRALAGSPGDA